MISLSFFVISACIGVFGVILSIDFCEYLKKYQPKKWELITYENPFGIPRQDFLIHPIKPHKFFFSIFSSEAEEWHDENVSAYKQKLKLVIIAFVLFLGVLFFIS